MLNILWPIVIIVSIIYSIFSGNIEATNNAVFKSAEEAIQLVITFFGTICLWNGIMEILKETSLMEKISKFLSPIMRFLFPEINKSDKEYEEISMNIIANLLGLGNAATPLGLKAMKTMQEKNKNKDYLTNSMAMFLVVNTAAIQIIPTTVIGIRNSLESKNPTNILFPVWISTICAAIVGIMVTKICILKSKGVGGKRND